MLKILLEQWDKNKDALREKLATLPDYFDYKDLVKVAFEEIYNRALPVDHLNCCVLDTESITVIDDGDYQGTQLFLIPFDTYQPSESEYLLTYVGYGSCSGCDTLLSILDDSPDERTDDLLKLCKDIITNTIRPYNYGWRYSSEFDRIDY